MPTPFEHVTSGRVGDEVERVLAGAIGPVAHDVAVDRGDSNGDRVGRVQEELQEVVGRHATGTTSTTAL